MTGIEFIERLDSWTSQIRTLQYAVGFLLLWMIFLTCWAISVYKRDIARIQKATMDSMKEELSRDGAVRQKLHNVPLCDPHGQKTIKADKNSDAEIEKYNQEVERHNREVDEGR